MVFFHESQHTSIGGGIKDPKEKEDIGDGEKILNKMRLELTEFYQTEFGQRSSYFSFSDFNGHAALPFSDDTKRLLNLNSSMNRGKNIIKFSDKYAIKKK